MRAFAALFSLASRHGLAALNILFAALFVFAGFMHPALAQVVVSHGGVVGTSGGGFGLASVGDVFCNLFQNIGPFVPLMNGIAYVSGALLIGQGVLKLKNHAEDARNNTISQACTRLAGGAALLVLPYFAHRLVNTLFFVPGGGGLSSCIAVSGGGSIIGGNIGLDTMLLNMVDNIEQPLIQLLSVISIIIGVYFIIKGLHRGAKYGQDPRTHSVQAIAIHLVIGTILIVIGQSLDVVMFTMFGTSNIESAGILSWSTLDQLSGGISSQFKTAVFAALTFFQLVGFIAFVRGWIIVKGAAEGNGKETLSQGFTHILGGVMAINIYGVLYLFDQTFGTGLFS